MKLLTIKNKLITKPNMKPFIHYTVSKYFMKEKVEKLHLIHVEMGRRLIRSKIYRRKK
jgi:hypothetical protein